MMLRFGARAKALRQAKRMVPIECRAWVKPRSWRTVLARPRASGRGRRATTATPRRPRVGNARAACGAAGKRTRVACSSLRAALREVECWHALGATSCCSVSRGYYRYNALLLMHSTCKAVQLSDDTSRFGCRGGWCASGQHGTSLLHLLVCCCATATGILQLDVGWEC